MKKFVSTFIPNIMVGYWLMEIKSYCMILKDYPPNLALTAYIKCYRIVHFDFAKNIFIPLKAYPPKPEMVLHFFLRDNFAIIQNDGKKVAFALVRGTRNKSSVPWRLA